MYRELVLEHARAPRNFGELSDATHEAVGHNPLCGDRFRIQLRLADDRLEASRFDGHGCAISTASASLMTEAVTGIDSLQARELVDTVLETLADADDDRPLGTLDALKGVRAFPTRIKCATLPWHTLRSALTDNNKTVTTE